jgi:hypothetical protein
MALDNNYYGIVPPTGEHGTDWPVHHTLPQGASGSLSTGGWTADNIPSGNFGNEGFIQQTFLGASIQNFDLNAGFGDTTSTLSVQLVNDEFHKSDGNPLGVGDDPYHDGKRDTFLPPVVGTPVFFKFGKNPASIEQAFRQTYDDLYRKRTLPPKTNLRNAWGWPFPTSVYDPEDFNSLETHSLVDLVDKIVEDRSLLWDSNTQWRGRNHFVFGGILQSYTQNKSSAGSPLYSVSVSDPREILSSVQVLLNSYQGTTFNNKNIINVYGFLEYDPSTALLASFEASKREAGVIEKFIYANGTVDYIGVKADWNDVGGWETGTRIQNLAGAAAAVGGIPSVAPQPEPPKVPANVTTDPYTWSSAGLQSHSVPAGSKNLKDEYYFGPSSFNDTVKPEFFPITGQGFSRRSDRGMPWYRVAQALAAMFEYHGFMPQEYLDAGFGGQINFRGFNYVVDFTGIPTEKIPLLYYMDFDKIDILSLAQELCDIISHDLYVTLLPVIDHPDSKFLYDYNNYKVSRGTPNDIIVGIIRLDAIDRSVQPAYGAIKSYLDALEDRGIEVENQDVGFELANITTDKFVVGGQEVDMHLFSTEKDRDDLWKREANTDNLNALQMNQWDVRTQLQQQVLPYYGMLGKNAVSIPRGFGSYQQILLDSSNLNAFGVGNYYVATEMELRAALISYDAWKEFLLLYNELYIEDISEHQAVFDALSAANNDIDKVVDELKSTLNSGGIVDDAARDTIQAYLNDMKNRSFAVTVPRCVWASDRPWMTDGYPASPCSPPLGYPLYYKRATRIGILEAGVGSIANAKLKVSTGIEAIKRDLERKDAPLANINAETLQDGIPELEKAKEALLEGKSPEARNVMQKSSKYKKLCKTISEATALLAALKRLGNDATDSTNEIVAYHQKLETTNPAMNQFMLNIGRHSKKHLENSKKVYEFVRKIADECLGKKFLVRLPKSCNLNYNVRIRMFNGTDPYNIESGPFGFAPRPINADPNYASSLSFQQTIARLKGSRVIDERGLFHHYLEDYANPAFPDGSARLGSSDNYTQGAMKGNYNPFSEKWEWNYKPEPQGGFYSHSLFGSNFTALDYANGTIPFSALPVAVQQGLMPIDTKNLLSDSNRLQCYVKYNNSHTLDFTGVNAQDMTQQSMTQAGQFVPDIVEDLQNNRDSTISWETMEELRSDQRAGRSQPDSVAFVKCSVEEVLFLPPKLEKKNRSVWANIYEMKFAVPEVEVAAPKEGDPFFYIKRPLPVFGVPRDGGSDSSAAWTDFKRVYDPNLDAFIIDTQIPNLDDEHVYALITVPGRIKSTIDSRWRDGPKQAHNCVQIKHMMTADVVKIPEFARPSMPQVDSNSVLSRLSSHPGFEFSHQQLSDQAKERANAEAGRYGLKGSHLRPGVGNKLPAWIPGLAKDWMRLDFGEYSSARLQAMTLQRGKNFHEPEIKAGFTSPSPIFPDIVAIPLMSQERCYGPWMSASQLDFSADSRVKYSNIGGRVEFDKDEDLVPWGYGGYQLMDEAGSLKANFSNSLLLFSERGGFVMPDAPTGIALASALKAGGPLITSIGVSVGGDGVKTTVKMDLYTSSFGKLQKQKEMSISQVARERQKTLDERNSAIRRGLGKRQTSSDLVNTVMQGGGQKFLDYAAGVAAQKDRNDVGKKVQQQLLILSEKGGASMREDQMAGKMESETEGGVNSLMANTTIIPIASLYSGGSSRPHATLASEEASTEGPWADRSAGYDV